MKTLLFPNRQFFLRLDELTAAAKGTLVVKSEPMRVTLPLQLTRSEWKAWETAKQQGYLRVPRTARVNILNVYFYWCEATQTPYIVIKDTPKIADINIDYKTTTKRLSKKAGDSLEQWYRGLKTKALLSRIYIDEANLYKVPQSAIDEFRRTVIPKITQPRYLMNAQDEAATRLRASRLFHANSTTDPKVIEVQGKVTWKPITPSQELREGLFGCYVCGQSHSRRQTESWSPCAQVLYEHIAGNPSHHDLIYQPLLLSAEPYGFRLLWEVHQGRRSRTDALASLRELQQLSQQVFLRKPLSVMIEELSTSDGTTSFRKRYQIREREMRNLSAVINDTKETLGKEYEQRYPAQYPVTAVTGQFAKGTGKPILAAPTEDELKRVSTRLGLPLSTSKHLVVIASGYAYRLDLSVPCPTDISNQYPEGPTRLEAIERWLGERWQSPPIALGREESLHNGYSYFPEILELDRRFWYRFKINHQGDLLLCTQPVQRNPLKTWYPIMDHRKNKNEIFGALYTIEAYLQEQA